MESVNRRSFLSASLASGALPFLSSALFAQDAAQAKLPNIIWLIADDVGGRDLGCYGHPTLRTPNLDRLSGEGLRFTNAFVTTSSCSPSRASMFTGKYPHSTGAENLHDPLPQEQKILPELLKPAGYRSGIVKKVHLGKTAEAKFDYVSSTLEDWKTFLDARKEDEPFFLTVGFTDAHRPFDRNCVDPPYQHDEIVVPPYLPDITEAREEMAGYYDEITRMDGVIGEILNYLDENGLADNTIVLFVSDNGMPFPRAKTTLYDSGIQTPLIIRWNNRIQPGTLYDGLASTVDLLPTMLHVTSIDTPKDVQGVSLIRQMQDPQQSSRSAVYAEKNWHDLEDHSRAVRTLRYKYIRNFMPQKPLECSADITRGPLFQKMRQMRDAGTLAPEPSLLFRSRRADEELYDIVNDPHELRNLAYDPTYQRILGILREDLNTWMENTADIPPEPFRPDEYDPETGERLPNLQKN